MSTLSARFAHKLAARAPLVMDPARPFAVKRNVHELVIGADADRFAGALTQVMSQPDASFGAITLKRVAGREGQPFTVGERFTGCVQLSHLGWPRMGRLGAWLEDAVLSDFAEIVELAPRRVVYRYLSGCPMAGSSTFTIDPVAEERCRFRVVFEYQEVGGFGITALNRFGLKLHDAATRVQAELAAARLGARILDSTLFVE
jgi:hypothetical protein